MFSSIQVTDGYAAKLVNLKDKKFVFTDKINVLFGPNGSGKTTLLRILGAYAGIDMSNKNAGGGWSVPPNFRFNWDSAKDFPQDMCNFTPGKCKANVEWDGIPAFFHSAKLSEAGSHLSYFASNEADSPDGLMGFTEQVQLITTPTSEGEFSLYKIKKVADALQKPPKPYTETEGKTGASYISFANYVSSLSRDGKPTLLWDEPDRSLSISNQILFWIKFLPQFSSRYQVVIATHCYIPMCLRGISENFNIIDVQEGYLDESKFAFLDFVKSSNPQLTEKEKTDGETPKSKKSRKTKATKTK